MKKSKTDEKLEIETFYIYVLILKSFSKRNDLPDVIKNCLKELDLEDLNNEKLKRFLAYNYSGMNRRDRNKFDTMLNRRIEILKQFRDSVEGKDDKGEWNIFSKYRKGDYRYRPPQISQDGVIFKSDLTSMLTSFFLDYFDWESDCGEYIEKFYSRKTKIGRYILALYPYEKKSKKNR